jgi:DNA-binding Xre family transcriptional regulator
MRASLAQGARPFPYAEQTVGFAVRVRPEALAIVPHRDPRRCSSIATCRSVTSRRMKAAKRLGITQPRVSEITRGKVELLSLDYLVGLCAKAGIAVGLRLAA